ncbi:hypothetical protein JHK87_046268 [Glycine soja]|nr:hypothetical protein JHK87_046268 [Glycine soja]
MRPTNHRKFSDQFVTEKKEEGISVFSEACPLTRLGHMGNGSKHLFFLDVGAVRVVRVRRNGAGDFTTVTDAVNSIPSGNKRRVVVWIGMGEYRENVTVDRSKPFVTFYGERNGTDNDNDRDIMPIITYDATALRYGTVDSATVAVDADYFVAVNLASLNAASFIRAIYVNFGPMGSYELNYAFTNSFAGELLKAGIISNPDNNEVIWRITTNLSSIVSTLPANCKAIGCTHGAGSHSQGSMNFGDYIRAASDEQIYVFVVGQIDTQSQSYIDDFVKVSDYDLVASQCLSRVISAMETKWGIS